MTRSEFFQQLEKGLSRLPREEVEGALSYYVEYFDDAGPEAEERVLKELGDPSKIAQHILAESMVRSIVARPEPAEEKTREKAKEKKSSKGISAVWTVILAVFAAPIALPVAIAIAALALALVLVAAALVLSFFVLALGLLLGGVFGFFVGCASLTAHVLTGLCGIGLGLALAGLGLLLFLPAVWLARTLFTWIAQSIGRRVFVKKGEAL